MKRHRRKSRPVEGASYICPTCGETIVVSVDPSGGVEQEYTEDCPVCCHPNVIHVEIFEDPDMPPRIWADSE